ncbi:MAG: hypothetical protein P1P90_06130 [Patescibacteria group bacterium]|nr:hypothetical protein [Patescibacteria group bacterium]
MRLATIKTLRNFYCGNIDMCGYLWFAYSNNCKKYIKKIKGDVMFVKVNNMVIALASASSSKYGKPANQIVDPIIEYFGMAPTLVISIIFTLAVISMYSICEDDAIRSRIIRIIGTCSLILSGLMIIASILVANFTKESFSLQRPVEYFAGSFFYGAVVWVVGVILARILISNKTVAPNTNTPTKVVPVQQPVVQVEVQVRRCSSCRKFVNAEYTHCNYCGNKMDGDKEPHAAKRIRRGSRSGRTGRNSF